MLMFNVKTQYFAYILGSVLSIFQKLFFEKKQFLKNGQT